MILLHNNERFDPTKFDEDKIVKESIIKQLQFNPQSPAWTSFDIEMQELEDETSFV